LINKYITEFKQLIKIGVPIFGSQLSYMLMGATDTIIAGRASSSDLAGLAVGNAFSTTIWMFISGVIFSGYSNSCSAIWSKKVY
jgi:MATE family multidrug resistance protein